MTAKRMIKPHEGGRECGPAQEEFENSAGPGVFFARGRFFGWICWVRFWLIFDLKAG